MASGGICWRNAHDEPVARLLERSGRVRKLFFCQVEALETAIYITEVAKRYGDAWIENDLRAANDASNPGLPRMALKMATGAGKTVVMCTQSPFFDPAAPSSRPVDGRPGMRFVRRSRI